MNTNSLSLTKIFAPFAGQKTTHNYSINYWKTTLIILSFLIISGYILNMISGLAALILEISIGLALALKPIMEILKMDFDLDHLELQDLHEELWN